ncbi:MAG: hypothetical protein AB7J40_03245 [Candidatus Altimarinota bacterium]
MARSNPSVSNNASSGDPNRNPTSQNPDQQAGQHAESRRRYKSEMQSVPAAVGALSKRVRDLQSRWNAGGSLSMLAAEQERAQKLLDVLDEKLGTGLEVNEKERADQKRRKDYVLVGNLVIDPRMRDMIAAEVESEGTPSALAAFEEAARKVADKESEKTQYQDRLAQAQVMYGAHLRPALKQLADAATSLEELKSKLKSTPLKAGSKEGIDFERVQLTIKTLELLEKGGENQVTPEFAAQEIQKAEKKLSQAHVDFAAEMKPLMEGELAELEKAINDHVNPKVKGSVGSRTNFFDDPEISDGEFMPFDSIRQQVQKAASGETNMGDLIHTLEVSYERATKLLSTVTAAIEKSEEPAQIVAEFQKQFPSVNLKAGLLNMRPAAAKVALIREIKELLEASVELLSRQKFYVQFDQVVKNNTANVDLVWQFEPIGEAQTSILHEAKGKLIDEEQKVNEKRAVLGTLNVQKAELKAYEADFKAAVGPNGPGRDLFRQLNENEQMAKAMLIGLGKEIAKLQKMSESHVTEALSTPMVLEFMPEELRQLLLAQAGNPKNTVITMMGRKATYFTDLLDQTNQKLASNVHQEALEFQLAALKEARDRAEIELRDRKMQFDRDRLAGQLMEIGRSIMAAEQASDAEKRSIYSDVEMLVGKIMRFCDLIRDQLADVQDLATGAAARFFSDLEQLTRTAAAVGAQLELKTEDIGRNTMAALALIQNATAQGNIAKIDEDKFNDPQAPAENVLTLAEEQNRLRSALLPLVPASADQQTKRRFEQDAARMVGSMQTAVAVVSKTLHGDVSRIDRDVNELLTEVIRAVSQMCQDAQGFKNELEKGRALVNRRDEEARASAEALAKAEEALVGTAFEDKVRKLLEGQHPENPLQKVLRMLEQTAALRDKLTNEISNHTKRVSKVKKDDNNDANNQQVDLDPELTKKEEQLRKLNEETIPTLESMISNAGKKARSWAEAIVKKDMDIVLQRASKEAEEKNIQWKQARAQLHAAEERFTTMVNAVAKLLDAQRALYTSADMAEVMASQEMASIGHVAQFLAKLKSLGPRTVAFGSVHGQAILRLELAEKVYTDLILPFLEDAERVKEKVGSDFEGGNWSQHDPIKLLGLTRRKVGQAVDQGTVQAIAMTQGQDTSALAPGQQNNPSQQQEANSNQGTTDEEVDFGSLV